MGLIPCTLYHLQADATLLISVFYHLTAYYRGRTQSMHIYSVFNALSFLFTERIKPYENFIGLGI